MQLKVTALIVAGAVAVGVSAGLLLSQGEPPPHEGHPFAGCEAGRNQVIADVGADFEILGMTCEAQVLLVAKSAPEGPLQADQNGDFVTTLWHDIYVQSGDRWMLEATGDGMFPTCDRLLSLPVDHRAADYGDRLLSTNCETGRLGEQALSCATGLKDPCVGRWGAELQVDGNVSFFFVDYRWDDGHDYQLPFVFDADMPDDMTDLGLPSPIVEELYSLVGLSISLA